MHHAKRKKPTVKLMFILHLGEASETVGILEAGKGIRIGWA